jgi:glycerol-3-phosphate dehydrogenase
MLPLAVKTNRCEIRARSYVREISVDNRGRVTGVIYFDGQFDDSRLLINLVETAWENWSFGNGEAQYMDA